MPLKSVKKQQSNLPKQQEATNEIKKKLEPGLKVGNLCLSTMYAALNHYFPNLNKIFGQINDFRQQEKVKYSPQLMIWMGVFERLAGFKSNNEFENLLQTSPEIENNISFFMNSKIDELPSIDAFCYFLKNLHPLELQQVIDKMFRTLERKKFLKNLKTMSGYILLAIDGVQTFSTQREIGHSINRKHENGSKTYHQYFLEAKIVSTNGFVMSLDTEPIENPQEEFDKQDCEIKAAVRLLEQIKRKHPHLKIWILGDALYCNSVIMDIAVKNKWKFSFTFKGKTKYPKLLEDINSEYEELQRNNNITRILKKNKHGVLSVEVRWCNNVSYNLGGNGERNINYLEGKVIREKNGVKTVVATFAFLVDDPTSEKNAFKKFMNCRRRWKIENEGFNFQKNNILNIGHNFSSVGHAGQNFYLLAQIAHTLIQLIGFTDIAGQVRREMTKEDDTLSQSLKTIFKTFGTIAHKIKVELIEKVFKPPLIISMRVRLKLA